MANRNKGFASMDEEKVKEIAHKGGEARKQQLGHDGYVELGHMGGEARKQQLGHDGYVELGHMGGEARSRSNRSNHEYDENRRDHQYGRSDQHNDRRSQAPRRENYGNYNR